MSLIELRQRQLDNARVCRRVQNARDGLDHFGNGVIAVAQIPYQRGGPIKDVEPLASLIRDHYLVADGPHEKSGILSTRSHHAPLPYKKANPASRLRPTRSR